LAYSILEELETAKGLMDVKAVAKLLNVTGKTIYKLAEEQRIPCIRIGASLKFDPQTLAYWVRKQNPMIALAHRAAAKSAEADKITA
jgi:excisionase family DNA binding protein